jgi:hypothetical protein
MKIWSESQKVFLEKMKSFHMCKHKVNTTSGCSLECLRRYSNGAMKMTKSESTLLFLPSASFYSQSFFDLMGLSLDLNIQAQ